MRADRRTDGYAAGFVEELQAADGDFPRMGCGGSAEV